MVAHLGQRLGVCSHCQSVRELTQVVAHLGQRVESLVTAKCCFLMSIVRQRGLACQGSRGVAHDWTCTRSGW